MVTFFALRACNLRRSAAICSSNLILSSSFRLASSRRLRSSFWTCSL